MKKLIALDLLLFCALVWLSGCTGYGIPSLTESKPLSFAFKGAQFGRDQLANRWLVGEKKLPVAGKDLNEMLTLLGQPQQVKVLEPKVSEDWYFIYYKAYKTKPETDEGSFIVRFYDGKVLDVISLN